MPLDQFQQDYAELFRRGTLRLEGTAIVGIAADGAAVQIGDLSNLAATARYLEATGSNPANW